MTICLWKDFVCKLARDDRECGMQDPESGAPVYLVLYTQIMADVRAGHQFTDNSKLPSFKKCRRLVGMVKSFGDSKTLWIIAVLGALCRMQSHR